MVNINNVGIFPRHTKFLLVYACIYLVYVQDVIIAAVQYTSIIVILLCFYIFLFS